jgi:hypothetical protein
MTQFVLTMVPLWSISKCEEMFCCGHAIIPANVDRGRCCSLFSALATFGRTFDFALQVGTHRDACHDDGPAAKNDVGFTLDVSFARDLVSGVLLAMSVTVNLPLLSIVF